MTRLPGDQTMDPENSTSVIELQAASVHQTRNDCRVVAQVDDGRSLAAPEGVEACDSEPLR